MRIRVCIACWILSIVFWSFLTPLLPLIAFNVFPRAPNRLGLEIILRSSSNSLEAFVEWRASSRRSPCSLESGPLEFLRPVIFTYLLCHWNHFVGEAYDLHDVACETEDGDDLHFEEIALVVEIRPRVTIAMSLAVWWSSYLRSEFRGRYWQLDLSCRQPSADSPRAQQAAAQGNRSIQGLL